MASTAQDWAASRSKSDNTGGVSDEKCFWTAAEKLQPNITIAGYWDTLQKSCDQWSIDVSVAPFWQAVKDRQPAWSNEFHRNTSGALLSSSVIPSFNGKKVRRIKEKLLHVAKVESLMDEKVDTIVPNIQLGTDGPVVQSFIFFSPTYIGEVRLIQGQHDFDIAIKESIANYRINIGEHHIVRNAAAIEQAKGKGEEPPAEDKTIYQKATVTLHHGAIGLITIINYFGDQRDRWLEKVTTTLPIKVLKSSRLGWEKR